MGYYLKHIMILKNYRLQSNILRSITNIPIIAQVSMHEPGILQNGLALNDALHQLEAIGADVVGVNCRLGPHHTIQAFEEVTLPEKAFLSAYPKCELAGCRRWSYCLRIRCRLFW